MIEPYLYLKIFLILFHSLFVNARIYVYDASGMKVNNFRDVEAQCEEIFDLAKGFIVLASPPDACSPIEKPSFFTNFTMNKFVLINGTDTSCPMTTKVLNAYQANYDLAVIFVPTLSQFECIHMGPDIDLPVVYVSYQDGTIIANNYVYNISNSYNYILIVQPNSPDMRYYIYLFGGVIGVCFFVMLLFMICLLIKCLQERKRNRRNRLSRRQIKQIPTAKFSKGDQYDVCAICLEDYKEGDKLRILPCSHAYHARCIDPWLMNNRRNCPLCKRKITFGDSNSDSESDDSELTSPTENTPLISSPLNREQSWGTFSVMPVNSLINTENSASSSYQEPQPSRNSNLRIDVAEITRNADSSDDEMEECLPPSHCSVNNNRSTPVYTDNSVQTSIHIICDNAENSSNTQHGLIV